MEFLFPTLLACCFFMVMAFQAGFHIAKRPTEAEMIDLLVEIRTKRKIEAITRTDIEQEIEQAAEQRVARS